jgi:septal ring factor EnvC (AmiA/AmiB activator)
MRGLQQEADRLASEERTLLGDLRKLEVERQLKSQELAQITARADATTRQLASTNAQVARLEGEDLAERPELADRLVTLYKLGQGRYLRMLLSVSDVRSLGRAARLVTTLAEADRERVASHTRRLDQLNAARASLQTQAKEITGLRGAAERARVAADAAVATRNARIANIDSARDLNAQLSGELQAAQQKLQATLRGIAAGGTSGADAALPLRPFRGDLAWPVAGILSLPFGRSVDGRPPSNGIEIATMEGTPVAAIHNGTVAFADTFAGFGKLVIIDHGSQTFSLYGNLLDIALPAGARVAHGDVIGTAGPALTSGPRAAGGMARLYFELRIDDRPVDPLQWLKRK